jgi:hypothetical protein
MLKLCGRCEYLRQHDLIGGGKGRVVGIRVIEDVIENCNDVANQKLANPPALTALYPASDIHLSTNHYLPYKPQTTWHLPMTMYMRHFCVLCMDSC